MITEFGLDAARSDRTAVVTGAPAEDRWLRWTARKFPKRSYLALQAEGDPSGAVAVVERWLTDNALTAPDVAAVAVVTLDGSVEHSRACVEAHKYNGAEGDVEAKDAAFYVEVGYVLAGWGGLLVQHGPRGGAPAPSCRPFQDACVAVFLPPLADAVAAVAAGLEVHRALAAHNAHHQRPWPAQLHARVGVGRAFADLLPGLYHTWRGDTVVEGRVWDHLGDGLIRVLLAAGVRRGGPFAVPAENPCEAPGPRR